MRSEIDSDWPSLGHIPLLSPRKGCVLIGLCFMFIKAWVMFSILVAE